MTRSSLATALLPAIQTILGISQPTCLLHKACRWHTRITTIRHRWTKPSFAVSQAGTCGSCHDAPLTVSHKLLHDGRNRFISGNGYTGRLFPQPRTRHAQKQPRQHLPWQGQAWIAAENSHTDGRHRSPSSTSSKNSHADRLPSESKHTPHPHTATLPSPQRSQIRVATGNGCRRRNRPACRYAAPRHAIRQRIRYKGAPAITSAGAPS